MGADGSGDVVTVERFIPAPAADIFALLADPSRHADIDGSGTVRAAKPAAPGRLALGSTFGMSMRMGIGYSMVSTVVEFEDGRRIAWQSRPPGLVGRFSGGRIWRYELEPADGGTRARESWDLSEDHQRRFLRSGKLAVTTRRNMEQTLARIEALTTGG